MSESTVEIFRIGSGREVLRQVEECEECFALLAGADRARQHEDWHNEQASYILQLQRAIPDEA
jgi:hypothetical protein